MFTITTCFNFTLPNTAYFNFTLSDKITSRCNEQGQVGVRRKKQLALFPTLTITRAIFLPLHVNPNIHGFPNIKPLKKNIPRIKKNAFKNIVTSFKLATTLFFACVFFAFSLACFSLSF